MADVVAQGDGQNRDAEPPDTDIVNDASVVDAGLADANLSDGQLDTNLADTRLPDTNLADTRLPDTQLADTRLPDTQLPDNYVPRDAATPDLHVNDAGLPHNSVELFAIGDSVTHGYCASDGSSYYELLIRNDDEAFPEFVGQDLRSHFAQVNGLNAVYNWGVNGATSCYFGDRRQQFIDMLNLASYADGVKLLVITLGGNDLIHNYSCDNPVECAAYCSDLDSSSWNNVRVWAANYKVRMQDLISIAQQYIPDPLHIFLANIYDPSDGVGDLENAGMGLPPWPDGLAVLELYNEQIRALCAENANVHCVDMRASMLGHGIHYNDPSNPYYHSSDPSYWYCSSLLEDPNDRGYSAIRGAFWRQIAAVLGL